MRGSSGGDSEALHRQRVHRGVGDRQHIDTASTKLPLTCRQLHGVSSLTPYRFYDTGEDPCESSKFRELPESWEPPSPSREPCIN